MSPRFDPTTALVPELPGELLFPATPWSVRLAQVCVGAAILVGVYVVLRRRAAARPKGEPTAGQTAHDIALERLRKLRVAPTASAAAHLELAAIARDYVAARFTIPARERTTEEIGDALTRGAGVSAAAVDALTRVLAACDRVKFAAGDATAEDTARRIDGVGAFVDAVREGRP